MTLWRAASDAKRYPSTKGVSRQDDVRLSAPSLGDKPSRPSFARDASDYLQMVTAGNEVDLGVAIAYGIISVATLVVSLLVILRCCRRFRGQRDHQQSIFFQFRHAVKGITSQKHYEKVKEYA